MKARTIKAIDKEKIPLISEVEIGGVVYKFTHQIGVGNFSTVYGAKDEWLNSLVVKVYKNIDDKKVWLNEVTQLKLFQCQWVPDFYAAFEQQNHLFLIMENAGIPVHRCKFDNNIIRQKVVFNIARGILQLLMRIHAQNKFHGDINPQNVLLKLNRSSQLIGVKLVDFAFCRHQAELRGNFRNMAQWIPPPEFFMNGTKKIGSAIDIWHTGVLLLQILKGEILDYGKEEIMAGKPFEDAINFNHSFGHIISGALERDPIRRPTAINFWRDFVKINNVSL